MDLLRHLNLFVTVAEEGHFGRAAARLGMTQPPLSQGVQRLEAELGVVLLTRSARMVRLTQAGADLLPAARALLDDAGALRTRAVEHTRPRPRVGVVPQLGAALAASSGTDAVQLGLREQTGAPDIATAFAALARDDGAGDVAAYNPVLTSATTARDMTRLLTLIWDDEAASPAGCRFARDLLGAQIWTHRLRAGFPRAARVAGKTGTIGAIRNEVGVVTFDGEHPVAVAVFTRAARADPILPRAEAVIGEAARLAVTELRSGRVD